MSIDNRKWEGGAVAARTLLALFVIFGLVVFFVPTAPLGNIRAQAQSSPSPSNTTGARIQFLNPSGETANGEGSGPGREVSTAQDADQSYHLVAWAANAPSNAVVEFKYSAVDNDTAETTIGTGTKRGNDTWDIFWNSVPATDGAYEVTAILYSGPGGTEQARDVEEVFVNNQDDPRDNPAAVPESEDRGETVEITYPAQAGSWGAFRQPGSSGPYAGVVDVDASDTSEDVRAYYTTTAPGSEPTWVRCSSPADGETFANSANGVRCTLAAGVNPSSVTAIAAAAGDANQSAGAGTCAPLAECGEGDDSGDAHRAIGYVQVPGTMTVAPASQTVNDGDATAANNQFPCSTVITGTLTDQFGRKVAGANVDVHAAGPTDNLHFDDPDSTGSHQAPNSNNHITEPSANCEDTTPPPNPNETSGQGQGEHEVAGEGDIKHIETAATGTNDAGALEFRLANLSDTITGTTQITVYYDRDNDDRFCTAEANGNAVVGWGTAPSGATGVPAETSTCSEPTPTPTGSSTASSSPTPTSTATSSASPTSSPTPGTSRTVTLTASDSKVTAGDQVTLNGQVFSSDDTCEDNEFVKIQRRIHGTQTFVDFRSTNTDPEGQFEVTFRANKNADYKASVTAHDNCADSSSTPVSVLVKVRVSIFVSEFRPERGEKVRILGKVSPKHVGSKVVLQRKKGGSWVKVGRDTLNKRSRYKFVMSATWRRDRVFRVKWIPNDREHESGRSQNVKVTVRRR